MLLVCAGDVYGGHDAYNRPKCQFIARMMSRFGYDAVALGEMDLNFGIDAIVEDNRSFDMKILCANVFRKTAASGGGGESKIPRERFEKEPVFPPYRIIEKDGVRFGVIAALSPALKNAKVASETGDVEALTYVIKEPLPILEKLVPVVKKRSNTVVLLAHMSKEELDSVLAVVKGVDMVILGHSAKPQVTTEPTTVRGVPVYMASHQGQYIGRAMLTFDEHKRSMGTSNEIRLLDTTIKDDPEVKRLVTEFDEENRRVQKELFVKEQFRREAGAAEPQDIYLGVATCQRCHPGAFDAYIQTKHARAYSTLSEMFMHRDSGCIPCHSTGYGTLGGFSGVRTPGSPVDLADVQCEACHGPAAEHTRDGSYRQRAREVCVKCHTVEQDPEFNYSSAWERIEH
jgi:predicted CXXCH cytochrome family protein